MLPESRRRSLLAHLARADSDTINKMSKRFHVSGMTIRRDLKQLQQEGYITLTHGGAVYNANPYQQREQQRMAEETARSAEKLAIARYAAAQFVRDSDVLALGSGATARAMVPFLKSKRNLTVVSNSLRTLEALYRHLPKATIISTGGILNADSLSFVGPVAERFFDDFYARIAFVAGAGLTVRAGLTDDHLLGSSVKRAIIGSAETSIVIVDSSKIGITAVSQVLPSNEIETLVTDAGIPADARQSLVDAGIDVLAVKVPMNA